MSRVKSSHYGAVAAGLDGATEFYWATQGNDSFSREQDMASMARALDGHDHTNGKGLAVAGYAAGSIPASAIVPNPIFPGMVTINSGLNVTGGGAAITGDVNISGFMWAQGDVRSTAGHVLAPAGHGIFHTGLTVDTGGATIGGPTSITGNTTIQGNLNIAGVGSTITQAGSGAVQFGGTVTISGGLGVGSTISNGGGGMTIAGNSQITGPLYVTSTLRSGDTLSVDSGGCQIHGTADLWGSQTTVHGDLGIGGSCGVTQLLEPGHDYTHVLGPVNIGVAGVLRWGTLYAQHTVIDSTSSFGGLLTCGAGLQVTSGTFTDVGNLTVHNNFSVLGNSGFTGTITPADNSGSATCGALGARWGAVYAINGTIQTSSLDVKEHLTELDPELALKVALDTKIHEFQYKTPDGEGGFKDRKTAKPRRDRQVGFIAENVHPLLLVAEDGVNGQSTASVALAAIQALSAKIEALTARLAELEGPVH